MSDDRPWMPDLGPVNVAAARAAIAEQERTAHRANMPNDREIAKLRALRQEWPLMPTRPGFTTPRVSLEDVSKAAASAACAGETIHIVDQADFDGYAAAEPTLFERDPETVAVSDDDYASAKLRDSAFVWHCRNRAGEIVDQETKEKADRAQAALRENSMDLALALAAAGVPAFLPDSAPRASIVCPESEQRIDIAPLRRVNFFPSQAKARRDPVVKALEAFASRRICRMATFTAGQRVYIFGTAADAVAERVRWMHRRLSRLNDSELFRSHGVQMQLRASEFGSITLASPWPRVPGTENGVPFVHIHAHVVYTLDHQLSPRRWRRFLSKVKNKWRFHWDESGKLENVREACKYPIKPGDYSHLTNEQVAAFYRATKGLHLVQPLGEFREEWNARKDAALKLVRERNAKRELTLKAKPDWNARIGRLTRQEKNARAVYREQQRRKALSVYIKAARLVNARDCLFLVAALMLRDRAQDKARRFANACSVIAQAIRCGELAELLVRVNPRPFAERAHVGARRLKELERSLRPAKPMRNRICARLAPAPYFDRVLRPALLVWNFTGDYAALRKEGFVAEYLDAVRPQIRDAEARLRAAAPFLRVHTSHTTAEDRAPLLERAEVWRPDPVPSFSD